MCFQILFFTSRMGRLLVACKMEGNMMAVNQGVLDHQQPESFGDFPVLIVELDPGGQLSRTTDLKLARQQLPDMLNLSGPELDSNSQR